METNYSKEERFRRAEKRVKEIKGFYWHLFWYLAVNIFLTFGTSIRGYFYNGSLDMGDYNNGTYTIWIFWGLGLAAHWINVFGRNIFFSRDWEERKIKEYMDKDKFE